MQEILNKISLLPSNDNIHYKNYFESVFQGQVVVANNMKIVSLPVNPFRVSISMN